jgi:hypothetical protein
VDPDTEPVMGETFVFTQFAGEPQCFLTEGQLLSEMASAGFDALGPFVEHNRPTGTAQPIRARDLRGDVPDSAADRPCVRETGLPRRCSGRRDNLSLAHAIKGAPQWNSGIWAVM